MENLPKSTVESGTLTVFVDGNLDYMSKRLYRDCFNECVGSNCSFRKVSVDMSDCSYLDTAGIGILIYMRKQAKQKDIPFTIVNISEDLLQMLKIVNIDSWFTIE